MEARALAAERAAAEAERALAAERAASAAERERSAALLAAAEEALARQLAAMRLAAPLAPRVFAGVSEALRSCPETSVPSPAKMTADSSIQASLAAPFDLCARPLSPALAALAAAQSLERWGGISSDAVLSEESAYPIATAHVPAWVNARERPARASGAGSESASTLFLPRGLPVPERPSVPGVGVAWNCFPELLTAPHDAFHPAFNGEVKSARSSGDKERLRMFDELLTYLMLGMLASFFEGVPAGAHRFFRAPPYSFGLLAFPHVGYLVCVEWAGKLLASVVSEPFFVGSAAHAASVARLPDRNFSGSQVDLRVDDANVSAWPTEPGSRAVVIWRVSPPAHDASGADARFFKILRGTAFDASYFRNLFAVYSRYAEARAAAAAAAAAAPAAAGGDRAPPLDAALVDAELLFGAGEVCVLMPWVCGRDAEPRDLAEGGCAVTPVARAIVWLARNGLLYTDLRGPNVRIIDSDGDGGGGGGGNGGGGGRGGRGGRAGGAARVTLIDYDDCAVVDPPAEAQSLVSLLVTHNARFAAAPDMPGALPAVMAALRVAWAEVQ